MVAGCAGYCDSCDSYRRRVGHYPAAHEIVKRRALFVLCRNCGTAYVSRRGLCNACARWEERHHEPRPAYRWQVVCRDCKERLARTKGLCRRCYQWRWRHNGKRQPRYKLATVCSCCGNPALYAKGMCCACYRYQYRFGKPRPAHLWQQRWNPAVGSAPADRARCLNCGKPSQFADAHDLYRQRCKTCHGYLYRNQRERPPKLWQRWAPHGWCDCGQPAVTEVTLSVDHGATKYKLCRDCYQLEVEK